MTLQEVITWARESGQPHDALYELQKVPARLGLHDEDLGLISADLSHFENRIAPAPYASVSRSRDLEAARRRGNARLRAMLRRFHQRDAELPSLDHLADWDELAAWIDARSAPPRRNGQFAQGTSRGLLILRARAECAPAELTQERLERIARLVSADKRRTLRRSVALLERLRALPCPELAGLLPAVSLFPPRGVDRAEKLDWNALPEAFRTSVDVVVGKTLNTVEYQGADARRRIAAGEDPETVIAEFNTATVREVTNPIAAEASYRGAITWLVRWAVDAGMDLAALSDIRDVFCAEMLEPTIDRHVAEANASAYCKNAANSQTLHSHLVALRTIARRGLCDPRLLAEVEILLGTRKRDMRKPSKEGPTDDIMAFCKLVQSDPRVAQKIVNAPAELAAIAEATLARAGDNPQRELAALRLFAGAALMCIQMSRPLRTSNLRYSRVANSVEAKANLATLRGGGYEAVFPCGEIKNDRIVAFEVVGTDADIHSRWIGELRPRYAALRGIAPGAYLVPGASKPRMLKEAVSLPAGCMSPGSFNELWHDAMDHLGVRMTPHMCRHAVATLILALEPGNWAKVAAVLGDTEETAKLHYGCDSGMAAAKAMREALLAAHPQSLKSFMRRVA
jgi:integrase